MDRRVENLKDMVLYRFGSTGVVQCLSRAAELLGLVPVFPVRNIHTYASGAGSAVFRDCVLVKKCAFPFPDESKHTLTMSRGSTVGDVANKVMGDVPISYIEGVGGTRVSEDEVVEVGKHDVCGTFYSLVTGANSFLLLGSVVQAWPIDPVPRLLCTANVTGNE